jgi:DNA polymerase III subunit delta
MTPPPAARRPPKNAEPEPDGPLHLVSGPEDVLGDRAIEAIVAAARRTAPDVEVVHVEPERYAAGDLVAHAGPSLFGEGTVLVVRSLEVASDDLMTEARSLVERPAPDVVLVLRHRTGPRGKGVLDAARKAGAVLHECPKIASDAEKATFVAMEFRRARRRIDPEAATALVEAVGQDLRELAGACAQLMADTASPPGADGKPTPAAEVDVELVNRYYGGRVEVTGFKVADAALAGRTDEALGLLRQALDSGVDPVPLVAVLAMGLRSLAKVSSAGSARSADAARDLGLAPWQVDKARRQLRGWTPDGLAEAIEAVAGADLAIKGGLPSAGRRAGDPVYAVERAVLTIGAAVRRP